MFSLGAKIWSTRLTNFNTEIYNGLNVNEARSAASKAGFEASIYCNGELVYVYSPILNSFRKV